MTQKKYTVKVYDKAGTTYKGSYGQLSDYTFTKSKNGGLGALSITLPRKFDEPNNDGLVNILDEIQIWVQDKETTGLKIYSGYVAETTAKGGGNTEQVQVLALGYHTRFNFQLDRSTTSVQVVRNSLDPTAHAKDIIDDYRTNFADPHINYVAGSTEDAGFTVSYTYNSSFIFDSLEKLREMAGANWYWYVDASNTFYWKSKPATPTHRLIYGTHITEIEVRKTLDGLVNSFFLWNGLQTTDPELINKRYQSPSSITSYWAREQVQRDGRIMDTTYADKLGNAFVDANKDINMIVTITVTDSNGDKGYDIESLEVGQTIQIKNTNDADLSAGNFSIEVIEYHHDYAILTLQDRRSSASRDLQTIRRELDTTEYSDAVGAFTSVDTDAV